LLKYCVRYNTSRHNVGYVYELFGIQFHILKYFDLIESRVFSEAEHIFMHALHHCQSYFSNILLKQWEKAGAISCSFFPAKLLLLCVIARSVFPTVSFTSLSETAVTAETRDRWSWWTHENNGLQTRD